MIPVKICGITRIKDARAAIKNGASALGFIFYEPSPRYMDPDNAKKIVDALRNEQISKVGVFVNESAENVNRIADDVGLDLVQLHGNETPEYCESIELPVIKSFRVRDDFNAKEVEGYDVDVFLFDAYVKGTPGGTGKTFNWKLLKNLKFDRPVILAGGLNPENITNAVWAVGPDAVDVSSGVEREPGIKDHKKLSELFSALMDTTEKLNPFATAGVK
ncbi:MAG: phosphoribosylanthranilate isomerase [Candidatus Marinimicrobia bacterium]|nr:phosphoribosylanthranilate isomerase [Candidatus Neomarinimicrobiota bacterium]MCF7828242.1 phosphoribosylanthranilate isomerase [Candidatus Neomarinimicrobiota bacterium]MCF7879583.1 phosphoribosylanthranilate isomerase [Candidatus Neomarinimicrobiota bacterium]